MSLFAQEETVMVALSSQCACHEKDEIKKTLEKKAIDNPIFTPLCTTIITKIDKTVEGREKKTVELQNQISEHEWQEMMAKMRKFPNLRSLSSKKAKALISHWSSGTRCYRSQRLLIHRYSYYQSHDGCFAKTKIWANDTLYSRDAICDMVFMLKSPLKVKACVSIQLTGQIFEVGWFEPYGDPEKNYYRCKVLECGLPTTADSGLDFRIFLSIEVDSILPSPDRGEGLPTAIELQYTDITVSKADREYINNANISLSNALCRNPGEPGRIIKWFVHKSRDKDGYLQAKTVCETNAISKSVDSVDEISVLTDEEWHIINADPKDLQLKSMLKIK